jgi:anthranilate synthase component 1
MHELILQQHGTVYPADTQTPVGLYMDLVGTRRTGILLESAEVDGRLGRYSLLAWDFRLRIDCLGATFRARAEEEALEPVAALSGSPFLSGLRRVLDGLRIHPPDGLEELPPITRSLLGYFGFELTGLLEPKLAQILATDETASCLLLPGRQILFDHLHHVCYFLSLDSGSRPHERDDPAAAGEGAPIETGPVEVVPGREEYCRAAERTRELINSGEAIQVVLSTEFRAPFSGDPFTVYRRLRQANPSPYMFYLSLPEMTLIGSSPELLVRCTGGALEERPIAGTRRRGAGRAEDLELAEELLRDPKERAEHVMLVDLGRNDLGRIAAPGSVSVERFMEVERFSHVMHLTSYLRARLAGELDAVDVLRGTFPAGTVSGAPKIRAVEIIREMEATPRGPYAGAVGWLGLDGSGVNLDSGITIRSLWIREDRVHWRAGAGIVSDSVPEREWEECLAKARIVENVLTQQGVSDAFAHR